MLVDDRARPRRGRGLLRARVAPRVLASVGVLGLMAASLGVLLLGPPAGAESVQPPPQVPTPTVTETAPAPTVTVTQRPPTVTATEAPPTVTETAPAPPAVTVTATATVSEPAVATAEPNPTATVTMTEAPVVAEKASRGPSATATPDGPQRTVPAGATSPAPPGNHAGASVLAGAAVALVAVGGVYAACRAVVYLR